MSRFDAMWCIGLVLVVIGFGGGVELTLINQNRVYQDMQVGNGGLDPVKLADEMHHSMDYLVFGVPIGMIGVVLLAIWARKYLLLAIHGRPSAQ